MPVRKLFSMTNDYMQNNEAADEGICTVASLQWCKKCLEHNRGLGSYAELSLSDHQLNALMALLRHLDDQPGPQTQGMGLRRTNAGDQDISTVAELQTNVANSTSKIAIFWNQYHTMAYRVGDHSEYEWFDQNFGCWLANNEADMKKFMEDEWKTKYSDPQGAIIGMRVVQI